LELLILCKIEFEDLNFSIFDYVFFSWIKKETKKS
jgi:hypothetical protein